MEVIEYFVISGVE